MKHTLALHKGNLEVIDHPQEQKIYLNFKDPFGLEPVDVQLILPRNIAKALAHILLGEDDDC